MNDKQIDAIKILISASACFSLENGCDKCFFEKAACCDDEITEEKVKDAIELLSKDIKRYEEIMAESNTLGDA